MEDSATPNPSIDEKHEETPMEDQSRDQENERTEEGKSNDGEQKEESQKQRVVLTEQTLDEIRALIKELLSGDLNQISRDTIKDKVKEKFGKDVYSKAKKFVKKAMEEEIQIIQQSLESAAEEEEPEPEVEVEEPENDENGDGDEDYEDGDEDGKKKKRRAARRKRKSKSYDEGESGDDLDDEETSSRSRKKKIGPAGAKTAFIIFSMANREKVKEEEPDLTLGEVSKVLGAKWKALSKEEREPYEQQAKADKERYQREMEELKENNPDLYQEVLDSKKRKRKRKKGEDEEGESSQDEEETKTKKKRKEKVETEKTEFDAFVDSMKNKKQKVSHSEDEQKQLVEKFLSKMRKACQLDHELNQSDKPAYHKNSMAQDVEQTCCKVHIVQMLLDRGLLGILKDWLSPLSDGSRPDVGLRSMIYRVLFKLNIDADLLEQSGGLGKEIISLLKWPEETEENKELLKKIFQKWYRFLTGQTVDYKNLRRLEEESEDIKETIRQRNMLKSQQQSSDFVLNSKRAQLPQKTRLDFVIRPKSQVSLSSSSRDDMEEEALDDTASMEYKGRSKKVAEPTARQSLEKRLFSKRGGSAGGKIFKVSVTGR